MGLENGVNVFAFGWAFGEPGLLLEQLFHGLAQVVGLGCEGDGDE